MQSLKKSASNNYKLDVELARDLFFTAFQTTSTIFIPNVQVFYLFGSNAWSPFLPFSLPKAKENF